MLSKVQVRAHPSSPQHPAAVSHFPFTQSKRQSHCNAFEAQCPPESCQWPAGPSTGLLLPPPQTAWASLMLMEHDKDVPGLALLPEDNVLPSDTSPAEPFTAFKSSVNYRLSLKAGALPPLANPPHLSPYHRPTYGTTLLVCVPTSAHMCNLPPCHKDAF